MILANANDVPGFEGRWYFGLFAYGEPAASFGGGGDEREWSVTVWEHRPGQRTFDITGPDRAAVIAEAQRLLAVVEEAG